MIVRTMDINNKPLQIPDSKKWKGLTVYCKKCKTNVSDTCKGSGKPIKQCLHGDLHFYKKYYHVPGTDNERRTKNLGRDLDLAIKGSIDFEKECLENNFQSSVRNEKIGEKKVKQVEQNKPENILAAMARYVGFLNNDPEIVPEHRREKERSVKHLQDIERNFKYFVICLKQNGYNPYEISINEVTEQMIGKFHDYLLKDLQLSNSSYNRIMTEFRCLYNHFNRDGYNIRNPFKEIPRRQVNTAIETITAEEFNQLLEIVQNPEKGKQVLSTGRIKYTAYPFRSSRKTIPLLHGNYSRLSERFSRIPFKI